MFVSDPSELMRLSEVNITHLSHTENDKTESKKFEYDVHCFIEMGTLGLDKDVAARMGNVAYARWVMNQYNGSANLMMETEQYIRQHKLYCTYNGKRHKYVGHSRLGDVWLTKNFQSDNYQYRVSITELSDFGPNP